MKIMKIYDLEIELEKKRIKNMYLKVMPPDGRVRISAPYGMRTDEIYAIVLKRLDWIHRMQEKIRGRQNIYAGRDMQYLDGDMVYYDGQKYSLILKEGKKTGISLDRSALIMHVKPDSSPEQRKKILYDWYRKVLYERIDKLLPKWEQVIGVKSDSFHIRDMKTRWGSCNIKTKKLTFSLLLAKKSLPCVEYVVVHELVHLLEGSHNHVFKAYMDKFLPDWRSIKKELNKPEQGFIEK